MADKCALCGKKTGLFSQHSLNCGTTTEWFCGDCFDRLYDLSPAQRAQVLLREGKAERPDALRAALEQQEAAEKQLRTGWKCLRCGGEMLRRGRQQFKLGEETFFFSDINRLASGSMTLEILRCESCGKMEFYDPALFSPEDN